MSRAKTVQFKAETRQILDILIHSLYANREVFLRELISNASDALTRLNFELLTNRDVLDPDADPGIWISTDKENRILHIRDNGIGMNESEARDNLGTIARSGAREFLNAAGKAGDKPSVDAIIGQFGVGFYSAFMVADKIEVVSRSFRKEDEGVLWSSSGSDTFTLQTTPRESRGTEVTVYLKEDAAEFADESRIRDIIRRHSDFVPYPIYLGEAPEQVNQQTAAWRLSAKELSEEKAHEFYRQLTFDFEAPLTYTQVNVDAPVQLYALLYVSSAYERNMFALRKEDGLKLYARKILIREYDRDLLPEYLRFVQGVVDSEDIPLNVSREVMQNSRLVGQIRKILTSRVLDALRDLAQKKPDIYAKFYKEFGRFLKEGIASDRENARELAPLLRYPSLQHPQAAIALDDYIASLPAGTTKIYYLLGEDVSSASRSPHLDPFRKRNLDVLLYTDPIDPFTALSLTDYKDYSFVNAALESPAGETTGEPAETPESSDSPQGKEILARLKAHLGERVSEVLASTRLVDSPVRILQQGELNPELQKAYRLLNRETEPVKLVLEVNNGHPIILSLASLAPDDPRFGLVADQLFDNAMLLEGLHPDPAGMVDRLQDLIRAALH